MRSSTSTARALLQGVGPLACSLRRGLATDASPAASSTRAALEYCARLVREHDRDNFTWVVQLPKDLRARVIALRAFNLEALMISEQVSSKELPLVQIRFQWWRDALAPALEGKPAGHPVLMALAAVHAQAPLSRYQLRRLLDAREEDALSTQPPLTVQQLEQYAEGTASQLQYVQLAAAGIADREADHCASHVGKAVGISAVLRGTPFHASRRRSYLPLEVCAKHRVSQEELFRGEPSEAVRDVALEVASVARAHLEEARSFCSKLPKGASSVLQSATGAALYLQALERRNFDLFDSELVKTGGASPLWCTSHKRTFITMSLLLQLPPHLLAHILVAHLNAHAVPARHATANWCQAARALEPVEAALLELLVSGPPRRLLGTAAEATKGSDATLVAAKLLTTLFADTLVALEVPPEAQLLATFMQRCTKLRSLCLTSHPGVTDGPAAVVASIVAGTAACLEAVAVSSAATTALTRLDCTLAMVDARTEAALAALTQLQDLTLRSGPRRLLEREAALVLRALAPLHRLRRLQVIVSSDTGPLTYDALLFLDWAAVTVPASVDNPQRRGAAVLPSSGTAAGDGRAVPAAAAAGHITSYGATAVSSSSSARAAAGAFLATLMATRLETLSLVGAADAPRSDHWQPLHPLQLLAATWPNACHMGAFTLLTSLRLAATVGLGDAEWGHLARLPRLAALRCGQLWLTGAASDAIPTLKSLTVLVAVGYGNTTAFPPGTLAARAPALQGLDVGRCCLRGVALAPTGLLLAVEDPGVPAGLAAAATGHSRLRRLCLPAALPTLLAPLPSCPELRELSVGGMAAPLDSVSAAALGAATALTALEVGDCSGSQWRPGSTASRALALHALLEALPRLLELRWRVVDGQCLRRLSVDLAIILATRPALPTLRQLRVVFEAGACAACALEVVLPLAAACGPSLRVVCVQGLAAHRMVQLERQCQLLGVEVVGVPAAADAGRQGHQ